MRVIQKQLVKRCIDMINDIAGKGDEEYEKFWTQFGRNIKLGIVDDAVNRDKLAKLLRVRLLLPSWGLSASCRFCASAPTCRLRAEW